MRILVRENSLLSVAAGLGQVAGNLRENGAGLRRSFAGLDAQSDAIAALAIHVEEAISWGDRLAGAGEDFAAFIEKAYYALADADRFAADSVARTALAYADLTTRGASYAAVPLPSRYQPAGSSQEIHLPNTGSLAWLSGVIHS